MSWKLEPSVMSAERAVAQPPRSLPAGSHGDARSTMLALNVKSGGNKEFLATLPGSASTGEPTRTKAPAPAPTPPPIATTRPRDPDRYEIIAEHGRGGLGRVSRAHDRELGRDVAIKELLSRGEASEVRFLREALITAHLEHPGIVPVHEAGCWPDGTPFYAMKLVSGRSLRELIAERTTPEQRIGLLHHVIAVADAIAYAHDRNIIHRDLKPANIIVGDFGETIVIDWGLAKNLTTPEEAPTGGPVPANQSDDLTAAGTVLGTPAYMAPEQARGEHVDQRADVFAIGAMLWELCAPQKVPPTEARHRRRMLQRAGIDQDLATIIDKALDPDPAGRYPDAGALAADLKAFKSGARIAARHYSLFAMLAHWTRRHRTHALSLAAAMALAVTGGVLYIRNTRAAEQRAQSSLDDLTLNHAQLLLTTDPSAAIDSLATYQGADLDRANQIRAEATGRGVALLRAVPHTDNILWADWTPDGAIISLSTDGTITRTSLDGTSTVLARDVAKLGLSSYSPSRHLLAYTCDPSDVCFLDTLHNARIPPSSTLRGAHVAGISFSPDGTLLALMSQEAVLTILDVTDPAQPAPRLARPIGGGIDVKFLDDNVVVAGTTAGVEFVRMNGTSEPFSIPDSSHWDTSASEHKFALATTRGEAVILASFPLQVEARNELCHGPISNLKFIPGHQSVAYACREGTVGIWDLSRGTATPRTHLEGHADLIAASSTGDHVIAAGGNGTVTVLDLHTDLIASYKGHGFRLTALTPPTATYPLVISADARGGVRAWPLPARFARVTATASTAFHTAIFDERSDVVTATTWLPSLTTISPSTGPRTVEPHEPDNIFLERSSNGKAFATYGFGEVIELWSSATMTRTRVIYTGQGSVSQLRFVAGSDDVVTSGRDGRLIRWAPSGEATLIARLDQPVDKFAFASESDSVVFSSLDGALWRTGADGLTLPLRSGGSRVNRIIALPDQPMIYVGYANGDVIAIHTKSWQQDSIMHASGAVLEIAATNDGQTIAVATNDGTIHFGTGHGTTANPKGMIWQSLAARARHLALTPDGLLLAACSDGTIWLYSPAQRSWLCLPTGTADLGQVVVAANGKAAVSLDSEGRLIWIELDTARKLLDHADQPHQ